MRGNFGFSPIAACCKRVRIERHGFRERVEAGRVLFVSMAVLGVLGQVGRVSDVEKQKSGWTFSEVREVFALCGR
jgi:hypothetical protein